MKIVLCAFFICIISGNFSYSQEKNSYFNHAIRFNRLDFFFETSLLLEKPKLEHEFGLGFGINRTIFQKCLFPEMFYGLSTNFKSLGLFHVQGVSFYHLSFYNPNRNQREIHFFNEFLVGMYLGFGNKFQFYIQPEIGLQSETFHSDFLNKIKHTSSFGYSAKIGFNYVF